MTNQNNCNYSNQAETNFFHIHLILAEVFTKTTGGEGEIRTRGHLAMTLVFKTSALDRLCDLSPGGKCGSRTH